MKRAPNQQLERTGFAGRPSGYHPGSQRGVDRGEALVAPPTSGADRLPARQAVADLNRRRVWQHEQRQVTARPASATWGRNVPRTRIVGYYVTMSAP